MIPCYELYTRGRRLDIKSGLKIIGLGVLAVLIAACAVAGFVLTLAGLLYLSAKFASLIGYQLAISGKFFTADEATKSAIAVGGALSVGGLALFGVHRQNVGAAKRHRVDASLALRKEVFLQVADAAANQYQVLMSFASPDITEIERIALMEKAKEAFSRLQLVANEKTIYALLDANESWSRAVFAIRALGPAPRGYADSVDRLSKIQTLAKPFLHKLRHYQATARIEIECPFSDFESYLERMNHHDEKVTKILNEVRHDISRSYVKPDWWILKQLRGQVISDLKDIIPSDYFDNAEVTLALDSRIKDSKHLSFELGWGSLAATIGRKLLFHSTTPMSARQISASEVLMHLGLLAASEAQRNTCERLSQAAIENNIADGNSTSVERQLREEIVPAFEINLTDGLKQYLLHLTEEEAKPFSSLIQNRPTAPIHTLT